MEAKEKLEIEQNIAREIGYFYFNRNSDLYDNMIVRWRQTTKEVEDRRITRIEFDGTNIHITTSRPGMIIGYRGKEIDELVQYLKTKFTFDTLNIIEDRVIESLYGFQYALGID